MTGLSINVATAQNMAVTWGGRNSADGSSVVIDPLNDVDFGNWDSTARTFTVLVGAAQANANSIRVTARRTTARGNPVPMTFAKLFGVNTCNANGVAIAWRRTVLFLVGSLTLPSSDQAQYDRLAGLGYSITVQTDTACVAGDATGKTLVFISESVGGAALGIKLRDVAVPVIDCEGNNFPYMQMTGNTASDYGDYSGYMQVTVQVPSHPLAGGMSGTVTVYPDGWGDMNTGLPNGNAAKVAYVTGNGTWWAVFGYDTGAVMFNGYVAQKRRVGLFMRQPSLSHTNSNAWNFFDASVKWAVGDI